MSDDSKMKMYQEKKRRRLIVPTKTATPSSPITISSRFQYEHWKKSVDANLAHSSIPPAHIQAHLNGSLGNETVAGTTHDIQANKPSVIKSNPNVIG